MHGPSLKARAHKYKARTPNILAIPNIETLNSPSLVTLDPWGSGLPEIKLPLVMLFLATEPLRDLNTWLQTRRQRGGSTVRVPQQLENIMAPCSLKHKYKVPCKSNRPEDDSGMAFIPRSNG